MCISNRSARPTHRPLFGIQGPPDEEDKIPKGTLRYALAERDLNVRHSKPYLYVLKPNENLSKPN